jgi:PAS domain S-box-containing protein
VLDVTLARLATSSPEVVQNAIRVMMTSIAKLKQRELELAATAERLALATRAGGVGIWDYDVVNNRLTWDAQMFRLYGITNSSFGGAHESWQAGLHPEDRQRIDEEVQLALRGEKEFDVEYRVLWPDGTIRHIHACAVVQRDVSGQPLRVIGTNWDITPHHRLEALQRELEGKFQQRQKSESLGRMAGAIAHHFNNQLQVVMANLELAASNRPENGELSQGLGLGQGLSTAMRAARKAAEISTQLLTYLGQSQVNLEPLDLAEVCRRSLALLQAALPPSVVLETDLSSPGPGLHANANQIQQLLTNLVTNAWEASGDRRGPVRLAVKTVFAADIPTAERFPRDWQPQATAYACLEVADTGHGITGQASEDLFDPFFSTKSIGRGMGLPVVLGIARVAGGCVTVENHPGRGCVFRVFFPVSLEAVPPKPIREVPTGKPVQRGATVLVVEDDEDLRETLALTLKIFDFPVLTAEDGVAALELFRQHRGEIDCVLCDVVMPRMNGWETLIALRRLAPDLPVILLSGYSEAETMVGDHPERPQAFLRKPCEVQVLVNKINQLLPHRNR